MPAIAGTATPSVAKPLRPCPEPKSTISGSTLVFSHSEIAIFPLSCVIRSLAHRNPATAGPNWKRIKVYSCLRMDTGVVSQKYFTKQFHDIIIRNCVKSTSSIIKGHIVF
jgi:hypothetical protein